MTKIIRRFGHSTNSSPGVRTALLAVCAFAALFILRHIASNSSKVKRLADALHTCQDSRLPAAIQEDPLTNPIVYVPTPCNASESAQAQPAPDVSNSGAMKDMQEKLEALQKTLSRKDELLRVRNNQLVQAYDVLENRASLWNDSLTRIGEATEPPPDLLGVVAVVTDYGQIELRQQFRDAWYGDRSSSWLQETLGMRMVFVLGRNPFMVSDGTGIAHDTDDILAEVKAHDDLLRVDAVHKDGGEGNSAIVHDVWRVLPSKYSALFYAKVQANALPSPVGFTQVLTQYDARDAIYAGCMKSGQVITDWKSPWYEPQHNKFGSFNNEHNYMLHASASGYILSRPVALHVSRFSNILAMYANEDVMVGAWMLGLNVEHQYESGMCCNDADKCKSSQDAVTAASRVSREYLDRGGVPGASGKTGRRLQGKGEARCALHGGGCNGVCGMCTKNCAEDTTWKLHRRCVETF